MKKLRAFDEIVANALDEYVGTHGSCWITGAELLIDHPELHHRTAISFSLRNMMQRGPIPDHNFSVCAQARQQSPKWYKYRSAYFIQQLTQEN